MQQQSNSNPYEVPHAMQTEMRQDIDALKAALLAEQQQRAAEVTDLRREVHSLQEGLKQEAQKREQYVQRMMKEMLPENKQSGELHEFRITVSKHFEGLEAMLKEEVRELKANDTMRQTREASEKTEVSKNFDRVEKDLHSFEKVMSTMKDNHKGTLNSCVHDIQLLAGSMSRITQSWNAVPLQNLQTSGENPSSPGGTESRSNLSQSNSFARTR